MDSGLLQRTSKAFVGTDCNYTTVCCEISMSDCLAFDLEWLAVNRERFGVLIKSFAAS